MKRNVTGIFRIVVLPIIGALLLLRASQSSSSKVIVCDTACPICSGATGTEQ